MILYSDPVSPNCAKVTAVLNHLGAPYEHRPVSIVGRETKKPDYLGMNPNGLVPTLVDGELVLWESNAIILHLAAKYKSDLFPSEPAQRADVMRWMFWQSSHWGAALQTIAFERLAAKALPGFVTDEAAVARAQRELEQLAPVLEEHLKGRSFVVGEGLTLADLALAASASKRGPAEIDLSAYPRITGYLERVEAMPLWRERVKVA